jgi:hypothetical protein
MEIIIIKIHVILLVRELIINLNFMNISSIIGRSRWVKYADRVGLDYDASQIPPEW